MPTFMELPREIQSTVLENLNFPDLTRLRMTCRDMRDLPTHDMKRKALLRLEQDWLDAGLQYRLMLEQQRKDEDAESIYDLSSLLDFETHLVTWGYVEEEMRKVVRLAPCYTDLQLKSAEVFEKGDHHKPEKMKQYGERSQIREPYTEPCTTRQCVDCFLKTNDLASREKRWLQMGWKHVVACTICNQVKKCGKLEGRQKIAAVCDDCFKDEEEKFERYFRDLVHFEACVKDRVFAMITIRKGGFDKEIMEDFKEPWPEFSHELPDFKYLD